MNESDALAGLRSSLPSERARATEWFIANARELHTTALTEALENEVVPNIRRLIGLACRRAHERNPKSEPSLEASAAIDMSLPSEILEGLSGLLRHETEPVIGWLRRSAARDIGDGFEFSETFQNIELLRRRLRGLEALAAAHRLPSWSRVSLATIVSECRPPDLSGDAISEKVRTDDLIDSDVGLMSIVVGNALINAHEAAADLGAGAILVETGVSDIDFWISITNRFDGQSFELEHVAHTGTSTKVSHKGLGLSAMRLAAERLGYDLSLTASGGTVFFSLRGPRFRG